jgi:hypothetical protein
VEFSDVNGDGYCDLLDVKWGSSGAIAAYLNEGDLTFSSTAWILTSDVWTSSETELLFGRLDPTPGVYSSFVIHDPTVGTFDLYDFYSGDSPSLVYIGEMTGDGSAVGNNWETLGNPHRTIAAQNSGISYWGGAVLSHEKVIVPIYYGSFNHGADCGISFSETFVDNLAGTSYFDINSTYLTNDGREVENSYSVASPIMLSFGAGGSGEIVNGQEEVNLYGSDALDIISAAVGTDDEEPWYFYIIYVSSEIEEMHAPSINSCWYHQSQVTSGLSFANDYAVIPESTLSGSGCSDLLFESMTCPVGVWLANGVAHELSEGLTDGNIADESVGLSWISSEGQEMADLCESTYPGTYCSLTLGGNSYAVQELWLNQSPGSCQCSE